MSTSPAAARSYLYVPADRPERLAKAVDRGADALIVDLEDGVAPDGKDGARAAAVAWLGTQHNNGPQLWVRVNASLLAQDASAVVSPALLGVVLPDADPDNLAELDGLLTAAERDRGLAVGRTRVIPLIESAHGLLRATEIAASPRVLRVGIGEVDLAAELGVRPSPDRAELASLRLQVVVASAAAGIARPLAPTSTDFRDLDAFATTSLALLNLGFRARTAVHPAQLAVINTVFSPTEDEVSAAADLVERFEQAGGGVVTDAAGRMVDLAVVRGAREVLDRAGQ